MKHFGVELSLKISESGCHSYCMVMGQIIPVKIQPLHKSKNPPSLLSKGREIWICSVYKLCIIQLLVYCLRQNHLLKQRFDYLFGILRCV